MSHFSFIFLYLSLTIVSFPDLSKLLIRALFSLSDLSHVFSSVRRDLNFIDHTGDLGWKEYENYH